MLSVNIICIGKLKEKYLKDASAEYAKRLTAFCKLNIIELDEYALPDNPSEAEINKGLEKEGKAILDKISKDAYVYAMCIEGKQRSSVKLSEEFQNIAVSGKSNLTFIIGGSFGLSDEVKQRANMKLSMSEMTFPHQLARIMLQEQIYRAFQISSGGKYHK
ncbi:MAG: 23S rRNA (pseudouridine(1915)-N(3))-methyltransferase RlmH [Oscillospiraceae bacterium]|nr:23S rRNA (pseudouridine(1915)-N(3))-methyltransferase RlmH [Candidatus Limimonas coprohippi]MCQ2488593.1 23S rRNA (pseudouridine(1915)-N(3))-methyltransferase RlmH [Clostridia bacterium]